MRFPSRSFLLFAALFSGCDAEEADLALDQPIRVQRAQFVEGGFPGFPADPETDDQHLPVVTSLEFNSSLVLPGQSSKGFQGRASESASSIAVALVDQGSGHWILPTGATDPQYTDERLWSFRADFAEDLAAGLHALRVVAIDAEGRAGPWSEQTLCVASVIPDNLHACDPSQPLPAAVFSLSWSAHADVDLVVQAPDGRWITPSNPLVNPVSGGTNPGAGASRIDRDAVSGCSRDARRRENLVFYERPPAGSTFRIHATLFDGCGQESVPFHLGIHEPVELGSGVEQVQTFSRSGVLRRLDATGDNGRGDLLFEYTF